MNVLRFPLARVTLLFIAGIAAQKYFGVSLGILSALLAIMVLVLTGLFFIAKKTTANVPHFGIAVFFVAFLSGSFCLAAHSDIRHKSHYTHSAQNREKQCALLLTVTEKLKTSTAYQRYVCRVEYIDSTRVSGNILLNFENHAQNNHLTAGSRIVLKAKIAPHRKPLNPDQFDYGHYLRNKNIFGQAYADTIVVIGTSKNHLYYADVLRQRILSNLRKGGFNEKELQVFAALLLGQQQEINADIVRDYQFAGAVHILSVSGLHVGFVLLLFNFALGFAPNTKRWNALKLLITITGLWSFALLAGFSPSVVRSVVMFSFVSVGMYLKRSTNVFHTLLVSMLLILLFRPAFLFDVGFELSYLALFFIVWLQPVFANWWTPENRIIKYFWNILTVSFAAQIGTLPLSLYYFHQFPGLFFVTNLIVIPLLSIIMTLGLIGSVWALVCGVPNWLVFLLQESISLLNTLIASIAGFEKFILTDIPFNSLLLLFSYLLLIFLTAWMKKRDFNMLFTAILCSLLLQFSWIWQNWSSQHQREWIVYHAVKNTVICSRKGKSVDIKSREKLSEKEFRYMLQPYLTSNLCYRNSIGKTQNVDFFSNKKIYIVDSSCVIPNWVVPDIIVLTQSAKINLERLLQRHKPEMIIADGSNFSTYTKRWKATCRKQKIPFHATAEKGCYRLKETP